MKRSKHSLGFTKLFSSDMGELIPIGLWEVLPGDSFQHSTSLVLRCSPLLAPVMHPVDVMVHHFFVPNRLVFDDWEDFITGGPDGMDDTIPPLVTATPAVTGVGTLFDYMGIPLLTGGNAYNINAMPFRAYNLIWNEFFRDQDLQTEATVLTDDGSTPDLAGTYTVRNVNWEKDYFTTARPWEQKGPAINVPVQTNGQNIFLRASGTPTSDRGLQGSAANALSVDGAALGSVQQMRFGSQVGAQINIQLLREAFAVQRFEEARARYGSRYVEYLRYLGVRSSDARLQRPEYLGGGRQTIQFSEVLQTAEGSDPVGDLKGHGIAAMRSNRYRRFFEEHGFVITLFSVRPKSIYIEGIDRFWRKQTRDQYFQKEFEHIGQQEVFNYEINGDHATPTGVFGYQNRYEEYRRQFSQVSGEFRTSTLNYWHLARNISTSQALNNAFVSCVPTERVFAVPSQDVMYVQARHSVQARRIVSNRSGSHVF